MIEKPKIPNFEELNSVEETKDEEGVYKIIEEWRYDRSKKIEDERHSEEEVERERPEIEKQTRGKAEADKKEFKEKYESKFLDIAKQVLSFDVVCCKEEAAKCTDRHVDIHWMRESDDKKREVRKINKLIKDIAAETSRVREVEISPDASVISVTYENQKRKLRRKSPDTYEKGLKITMEKKNETDDGMERDVLYVGTDTPDEYSSSGAIRSRKYII